MNIKPQCIVFASATRTATVNSPEQTTDAYRGVHLVLDVTAASGTTPTLDVKLQAKDEVSGKWVDIPDADFAQVTAAGTADLLIYPGIAATANRRLSDCLPRLWRAVATVGGTTPSFTFSLAGTLLP